MRILNFGSLNIDFVYDVDHFVTAGETIASTALTRYPGGKGLNQSIALARAGADVSHAGQVGEDGRFLVDLLNADGVDTSLTRVSGTLRSGNAIIQRDRAGGNCIILYGGTNRAIDEGFVDEVLAGAESGEWLLLQNEISSLRHIVEEGRRRGMRIVLNPSPADAALDEVDLGKVDVFILNEVEAAMLTGLAGDADADELLHGLHARHPHATLILTLGEKGSVFLHGDELVRQDAFAVDVVDTTAAGDTFTGYLLASLAAGDGPEPAMRRAAAASAIAVTRPGAAVSIPEAAEVDAFLAQRGL